MDLSISMAALKNVFRFPFRDPKWSNKLLVGAALFFAGFIIPLVPLLPVMGYLARLVRAGARNEDPARLPEWDNWGELFVDGLRLTAASLIGILPGLVIMIAGYVVYMISIFSMNTTHGGNSPEAIFSFLAAFGVFFICLALGMLLMLASALVLPPAMAHVAVKGHFGAFFQVGEWWRILRANFGGFLIATGVFMMIYLLAMVVYQVMYFTIILCVFTPLALAPILFYALVVFYRLIGQAYGEATAPATPAAISPATAA